MDITGKMLKVHKHKRQDYMECKNPLIFFIFYFSTSPTYVQYSKFFYSSSTKMETVFSRELGLKQFFLKGLLFASFDCDLTDISKVYVFKCPRHGFLGLVSFFWQIFACLYAKMVSPYTESAWKLFQRLLSQRGNDFPLFYCALCKKIINVALQV